MDRAPCHHRNCQPTYACGLYFCAEPQGSAKSRPKATAAPIPAPPFQGTGGGCGLRVLRQNRPEEDSSQPGHHQLFYGDWAGERDLPPSSAEKCMPRAVFCACGTNRSRPPAEGTAAHPVHAAGIWPGSEPPRPSLRWRHHRRGGYRLRIKPAERWRRSALSWGRRFCRVPNRSSQRRATADQHKNRRGADHHGNERHHLQLPSQQRPFPFHRTERESFRGRDRHGRE